MQPTFRTQNPTRSLIWMIVFGLVCLGAAVALYFGDQIPSTWTRENGTITSYTTDYGGTHSGPNYCAVVTYKVNGASYSATAHSCGGSIPSVGAPAQIAYNPSDPQMGKVVGGIGDLFIIVLTGLIGLALIIFAPIVYKKAGAAPNGPGSVFTTQWPHVPNPVDTTTAGPPAPSPAASSEPPQSPAPPPSAPPAPPGDNPPA